MARPAKPAPLLLLLQLLIGCAGYLPHRQHPCDQGSCYPTSGNLLVGREKQLHATSTCGLKTEEKYCTVFHLEEQQKCFRCDSRPMFENNTQYSHTIENIINHNAPNSDARSWWQAENGKENVSIQLDLEAVFRMTHVIITFKTFLPEAMLIERSYDFGSTWQVYRYFAANCDQSFPGIPKYAPRSLAEVVCESRYYSKQSPSTAGEIIFRVVPPSVKIKNPYSWEVRNILEITNLRINFTKLHMLGDDLLDDRREIQQKYYYAIYEMTVRGSCSCNGHASRCLPLDGVDPRPDKVHSRCDCTHHTEGQNCELCENFYHDLPWKPAIQAQKNTCKKCNCNNHTTSCHFDNDVYKQSGNTSGGVCDGCEHNTIGRKCEQCKPSFYHDPSRPITDPETCLPCGCDPRGSVEADCDPRTDEGNGSSAGQCHCKAYADGRRCDRCKDGYWNLNENNPEGCQTCPCYTFGAVDNQGCDMNTGECICRPNVIGRYCDQCLPQHFGLDVESNGCRPCKCDPGGAFDNYCDVISGQCRCRPHVSGRQCNQPEQAFFTGMMDFMVYEAELAFGSENCQVEIREPYTAGEQNTWTGFGFMRTFENSDLDFIVDDVRASMEYDIVIRYESQLPYDWKNVRVSVLRNAPIERDGFCAKSRHNDDMKYVTLPAGERNAAVRPPVCLEAGKLYHIILSLKQYDQERENYTASILVDSIALIPRPESIPFFRETPDNIRQRDNFERNGCVKYFANAMAGYNVPELCEKYYYNSIGLFVQNGAHACDCDKTGSSSVVCRSLGGQCECKSYVVGRRCDRCAPGTFGFSPDGCTPCECGSIGSLDNICDQYTGQCKCRPNVYGKECDQCLPGFWSFPDCQRCQCNGYADTCESYTGVCTDCRNNTNGTHCDNCNEGYYGDPSLENDIPCQTCQCPDTQESGHSFANRCSLDPHSQDVVCECEEGYAGTRCDVCADNYFGNPHRPGGSCLPCNCSKNVDISRPGNCDHRTGQCLLCLFDTEGFNCELCKDGFFGDAVNQRCNKCVCNVLGTNETAGSCDNATGQCPCLPNVVGVSCDDCKPNHWKIASGEGCEACDCDPSGSHETQCNQFDGQCKCKPGYGGSKCDQCEANSCEKPNIETLNWSGFE